MTQKLNNTNEDTGSRGACGPGGSGARYRWKGKLPILWHKSLNPRQGVQDFECVTKHCFLKKQKLFSAGVDTLTGFVLQILLRDVEGIWSGLCLQKPGDQLLEGQSYGRHSALGGKQIQKKCPNWSVHANVSDCCSRSLQYCFEVSEKCTMGGLLLSIFVGSQMFNCLVTSLNGWSHAWERKLDEIHTNFLAKQQA